MAGVIVVGYDGTDAARTALDVACEMAKELDAKLVFAYGAEPYHGAGEIGGHRAELRKIGEEILQAGGPHGCAYPLEIDSGLRNTEGDVSSDAGVRKEDGLRHVGNVPPPGPPLSRSQRFAVDEDPSRARFEKTHEDVAKRALPASRPARNEDDGAARYLERNVS